MVHLKNRMPSSSLSPRTQILPTVFGLPRQTGRQTPRFPAAHTACQAVPSTNTHTHTPPTRTDTKYLPPRRITTQAQLPPAKPLKSAKTCPRPADFSFVLQPLPPTRRPASELRHLAMYLGPIV
ncbi:hypothetical protein LX36DRAFT_652069 [Colletotrichum falcatum]|nr:hypothetical protein LX36DRAFT_652069 [Colletotrichum falcatum]